MKVRQCLLPLGVLWSLNAGAGQLTLASGDSITGELRGIEGDHLLWRSDELGNLLVPKTAIKSVQSDVPLKIRGKDVPCVWLALLEDDELVFRCADGDQPSFPLLGVKHVIPFKNHRQANFAFTGDLRASGWRQTGNTEGRFWEFVSKTTLRHSDLRHILNLVTDGQQIETVDFASQTVTVTERKHLLGVYTLDWFFVPQWYWANKVSAERDDNRNIQEEYIVGSGLGYQFWETERTALALELGLDHSSTYLRDSPPVDEPERYTSLRLGNNFRYTFLRGLVLGNHNEFTQAVNELDAGRADRWRLKTDTHLQIPIGFGISASFNLTWDYVNYARDLNPNASRTDTTYRIGVNYAW